ncbi:hypothetical protein DL93DRAFT_2100424 [Clavulina sp. PMI_390]|nr:hypothetical protein DL93DRAFT_2100424 [Clavulina sp. PMI_390]
MVHIRLMKMTTDREFIAPDYRMGALFETADSVASSMPSTQRAVFTTISRGRRENLMFSQSPRHLSGVRLDDFPPYAGNGYQSGLHTRLVEQRDRTCPHVDLVAIVRKILAVQPRSFTSSGVDGLTLPGCMVPHRGLRSLLPTLGTAAASNSG